MSDYTNLKIEKKHPAAIITFTRPDVLNALNTETLNEMLRALQALGSDPDVLVIIITGTGKAFVAGADISEISGFTPDDARRYSQLGHTIMDTIQEMGKPVIAAINGYALGGGTELALSCDLRIASDRAKFALPEAALGVIPGWGATQRAARLIGTALAKELILQQP